MNKVFLIAVIVLACHLSACDDRLTGQIERAVTILDTAIADLDNDAERWEEIAVRLNGEVQALPREVQELIRSDIQSLSDRTLAAAGVEAKCGVDFIARRLSQRLGQIRSRLLHESPVSLPPVVCTVEPSSIRLDLSPSRWPTANFYGYDMDSPDDGGERVTFAFEDATGSRWSVPESSVGRTHHYQVTVNLASHAEELFNRKATKVIASWGKGRPSEVVVIGWRPAIKDIGPQSFDKIDMMPPKVGSGDANFWVGPNMPMLVTVSASCNATRSQIFCDLSMHGKEPKPDWTQVQGSQKELVYQAPSGTEIVSFEPHERCDKENRPITVYDRVRIECGSGTVVNNFDVWGDREGTEAGTWTRVTANFRSVSIKLRETQPEWLLTDTPISTGPSIPDKPD